MESIQPSTFDLVVLGTGLAESIVAAAAAKAGKSVLQLDPSPHYGGSWASLRLSELRSLLQSLSPSNAASEGRQARQAAASGIVEGEIWQQQPEADLGPDAQYSIDLAPKVAYGGGPLIQLLLGSGAHHYLEFKLVQGSYLLDLGRDDARASSQGQPPLHTVPSSRSDVFKDRTLSPLQKRSIMRFLKAAAEALEGQGLLKDAFGGQPVQELLAQQGLDKQLQLSVLHGVLMADCVPGQAPGTAASRQQQPDNLLPLQAQLTAEQALQRLRVYLQSSGRYGADTGPFLTPLYGGGELPQAFCRVAAVAGAVQVLRCGVEGLVLEEAEEGTPGCCTGVKLSSGHVIGCQHLAASETSEHLEAFCTRGGTPCTTLRCAAILDGPLVAGEQQTLVCVLPSAEPAAQAGTAAPPQATPPPVVRALAVCSSTAVCPPGRYLLYLWTAAPPVGADSDGSSAQRQAARVLQPVLAALADASELQRAAAPCGQQSAEPTVLPAAPGAKPRVLWAAFYSQSTSMRFAAHHSSGGGGSQWPANVVPCPGPDASATFVSAVEGAKQCYRLLFPPPGGANVDFPLDTPVQRQAEQQQGEPGDEQAEAAAGPAEADADSDDELVAALQAALQPAARPGIEPAALP